MSEAPSPATQLAEVGRRAVSSGLVLASGGNLSARLPDGTGVAITSRGAWLDDLGPESFAVVDPDGAPRRREPTPSSETPLHVAAYRARPDVAAVLHLHPAVSTLLTAMGEEVRPITTDHALYCPEVRTIPLLPSGSAELAEAVGTALAEADVALLTHHGCVVAGPSPRVALARASNLEAAAVATYRALALGDRHTRLPRDQYPSLTEYLGPLASMM